MRLFPPPSMQKYATAATARLAQRARIVPRRRAYSQKPLGSVSVEQTVPTDPRPPWLFASASLLRVVFIPVGLTYAVFFHDFGEDEHVFMPPRRWLQRQKEAFFTLSPAERRLADDSDDAASRPPAPADAPVQSDEGR
ncbi:hypothetical protein M0805_000876 [Coniferiporia weirii]|nr:hypothetical protein M0805_000876 [Coniferiporia weirii]